MFKSCTQAAQIFCSAFDDTSIMDGITDVIVIKHKSGQYRSTKFYVSIGPYSSFTFGKIDVFVNKKLIHNIKFVIDKYGYLFPKNLSSKQLASLDLHYGKNTIQYKIQQFVITGQIYFYTDLDRLLISDVDGTLTKNDIGGLYSNYMGKNYLHDGYHQLVNGVADHGYKVVWLTMRSLPMYQFSKNYIRSHIEVEGPLLMEPQQFSHAFKKQILRQTGNIKANLIKSIKDAFPENINPFIGGLGNREGDAIAYRHADIPFQNIYIVDTKSEVHKMDNKQHNLTYQQIVKELETHFPYYSYPKVGYF